jgi:hypothetical protein
MGRGTLNCLWGKMEEVHEALVVVKFVEHTRSYISSGETEVNVGRFWEDGLIRGRTVEKRVHFIFP